MYVCISKVYQNFKKENNQNYKMSILIVCIKNAAKQFGLESWLKRVNSQKFQNCSIDNNMKY